jgi:hypothetical protein
MCATACALANATHFYLSSPSDAKSVADRRLLIYFAFDAHSRLCDHAQPHALHLHAKPLQHALPRGRARDDADAQGPSVLSLPVDRKSLSRVTAFWRRLDPVVTARAWTTYEAERLQDEPFGARSVDLQSVQSGDPLADHRPVSSLFRSCMKLEAELRTGSGRLPRVTA